MVVVVITKAFELAFQVSEETHVIVLPGSGRQGRPPLYRLMLVPVLYSFGADNMSTNRQAVCCAVLLGGHQKRQ